MVVHVVQILWIWHIDWLLLKGLGHNDGKNATIDLAT